MLIDLVAILLSLIVWWLMRAHSISHLGDILFIAGFILIMIGFSTVRGSMKVPLDSMFVISGLVDYHVQGPEGTFQQMRYRLRTYGAYWIFAVTGIMAMIIGVMIGLVYS